MSQSVLARAASGLAMQAAITYIKNNGIERPDTRRLANEIALRLRARVSEAVKDAREFERAGQRGLASKVFFTSCAEAGVEAAREVTNTTFGLPGGDR